MLGRSLAVGALGSCGLSWQALLQAQAASRRETSTSAADGAVTTDSPAGPRGTSSFGRARRAVLLFLTGGPPQHDTWDPKPQAPAEIRGELAPIATRTTGACVSELFPKVAQASDKLCIVRSVTHGDTLHTTAGYTMLTGTYHRTPSLKSANMVKAAPEDHPHLGAILSLVRGSGDGLPTFVALPEVIKDANVNVFLGQDGGFLGRKYSPMMVEARVDRSSFDLPEVVRARGLSIARLDDRRDLLSGMNAPFGSRLPVSAIAEFGDHYAQAWDMLRSPAAQRAFDLDAEPPAVKARYGPHLFGQGCLLARRLLEAGVALVSVYWHYEGPDDSPVWDTHGNNFVHLRSRLAAPADAAISAIVSDLFERGMLDDTLVICMGEFGRTPKINAEAGRDHWARAASILLAGAGLPRGTVFGATDRTGGEPADDPISPPDLFATFLHLLGVDGRLELRDPLGRPLLACTGTPVAGLVG